MITSYYSWHENCSLAIVSPCPYFITKCDTNGSISNIIDPMTSITISLAAVFQPFLSPFKPAPKKATENSSVYTWHILTVVHNFVEAPLVTLGVNGV